MVPVEETLASSAVPSGELVVPRTANAVDPASSAATAGKYSSLTRSNA
jgi:hypothetical protein